jgi:hypothetical protein
VISQVFGAAVKFERVLARLAPFPDAAGGFAALFDLCVFDCAGSAVGLDFCRALGAVLVAVGQLCKSGLCVGAVVEAADEFPIVIDRCALAVLILAGIAVVFAVAVFVVVFALF